VVLLSEVPPTQFQAQVVELEDLEMAVDLVLGRVRALGHKAVVLKEAVLALPVLYLQLLLVVVARVGVIPTHHRVAREAEPLWVA
jgi:hypothetical protein